MILVALGSNLPGPAGDPRAMVEAALAAMADHGLRVLARSPWYRSAPVPPSDQPWFVNGVARLATADGGPAAPDALLASLHAIEHAFGRRRDGTPNAARGLDLDLLDVDGQRRSSAPILPHPRMSGRAFVLRPLADVAPGWRDPLSGRAVEALLADLGSWDEGLQRLEP